MPRLLFQTVLVMSVAIVCSGCSCVSSTFEKRLCEAGLSVRGRVLAKYDNCPGKCDPINDQLDGQTIYIVRVLEIFKGPKVEDDLLFLHTAVNGGLCGVSLSVGAIYLLNVRTSMPPLKTCSNQAYPITICDFPERWVRVPRRNRLILRAKGNQSKCTRVVL